ncbi:hypothetical protein TOPH_03354 [Tolypocladium ophioglossoides CBS 100239]|uniref:Uncharacterized protein n=1 Tax=Tolypocladium ophioglossoides (strain CBS 100239) TaxID=1163406 RepID=A0A0L0NDB0_TOLOC|nr:hypothetical protein TOPH_03354 [Tolypocladium ophioglossoides CBS 100239]
MGKPSDLDPVPSPNPPSYLGESASSIFLRAASSAAPPSSRRHGQYFDDPATQAAYEGAGSDYDDLPPLYTDHEEYSDAHAAPFDPLVPGGLGDPLVQPFGHSDDGSTAYYLDPRLDSDPAFLVNHVTRLAALPPRPFVRLRGTHRERRRGGDKDRHGREEVVDFDVRVELTHLLYADIHTHASWHSVTTAGNFEKVRRGTVFAQRAPGFGGSGPAEEGGAPDLERWCHRFCASDAGLKCFTLQRRVDGWDWDLLRRRLEALVLASNYRGRCEVTFPVRSARVDVYNDCRANRWRLTGWICFLFYATALFVFTWPWLFLRTRRWETVAVEWHMSRPTTGVPARREYAAGLSEEQWYGLWARAIQRAMLERRDGELDQGDLERNLTGSAPKPPPLSLAGTTHDLALKTQYYTATVPIWLDLVAAPGDWAASFLSEEAGEVLAVLGGFVVVFALPAPPPAAAAAAGPTDDGDAGAARELIRQVGRVVGEGLGGWEWDGVRLAVGVGESKDAEEWDELCAEAGLEFVQVGGGQQPGLNEFGEKTGIARVKEALESNDWAQEDAASALSDFGDFEAAEGEPLDDADDGKDLDPESLDFGFDRADFEGLRRALWSSGQDECDDAEAAKMDVNDSSAPEGDDAAQETQKPKENDGAEEGLDDDDVVKVEKMMRKLQAVRDAGAGVSEAQRRKMAAKVVAEVMREL